MSVLNNTFRKTISNAIENVGCCSSIFKGNKFVQCDGDILSFSSSTKIVNNIITGNTCEGQCQGTVLLEGLYDSNISNNIFITTANVDVQFTERCEFSDNIITNADTSALIFDSSPNNIIHGGVFDNSLSTGNFACLRFNGAASTGNLAYNVTLIQGTGGGPWDEASGASGNNLREFRTSRSARFSPNLVRTDIPDNASSGHGADPVSTQFTNVLGTNSYRAYTYYTSGKANIVITHMTATVTDGQPETHIRCKYSGRTGNTVQAGEFYFAIGSFDDYDATPVFVQSGTVVTAPALTYDAGTSYPTWTIALFANDVFMLETTVISNGPGVISVTTS